MTITIALGIVCIMVGTLLAVLIVRGGKDNGEDIQ